MKWMKNRSFVAHGGDLTWTLAPKFRTISAVDADRSWTNSTQDIGVIFSEACSDAALSVGNPATGWSATVKNIGDSEAAAAVTYRSGSGTQNWVLRLAALVKHGAIIKITYNTATGATVSTSGSVEINGVNAVPLPDQLTKRVRTTLKDKNNVLVTNEAGILTAIFEYGGGVLSAAAWMTLANKATVTSDASAICDMLYTGTAVVADTVYAATLRVAAVESQIWTETVT